MESRGGRASRPNNESGKLVGERSRVEQVDLYAPCRDLKTKKREKNKRLAANSSCQFGFGNDRSVVGWGGGAVGRLWSTCTAPIVCTHSTRRLVDPVLGFDSESHGLTTNKLQPPRRSRRFRVCGIQFSNSAVSSLPVGCVTHVVRATTRAGGWESPPRPGVP